MAEIQSGYIFSLSESLRIAELQYPETLTPLEIGKMIVASDYSGQHKGVTHEAYSFIVTTMPSIDIWLPVLTKFRKEWLTDGRRMSFKNLKEPIRWKALTAYLECIGKLRGNLITILVDKRVGSFMHGGQEAIVKAFPDCFDSHVNMGTVEKMFRLANFIALILAGFRHENQTSLWISDHDEALDSHEKRENFARLATYVTFGVTGWHNAKESFFVTTELPHAPEWSEDLASIADLVAGAYCQQSGNLPAFFGIDNWKISYGPNSIKEQRANSILSWLATSKLALRHALLRLELDSQGNIRSSAQAFENKWLLRSSVET